MSMIFIKQALIYGINELKNAKINSARLDAEILISFILGYSKEKLISNAQTPMTNAQFRKYKELIKKRSKHWPVAYLTGSKEFYGIDFYVNENVLVPRPETELLVEEVLKFVGNRHACSLLELGTGSGCIALTLAKYLPKAKITATDISDKALKIAKKNRSLIQTRDRVSVQNVQFKNSNLLLNIKNKPDIIVANLPYLDNDMRNLLKSSDSKALKYEPQIALKGGPDGLDIYRKMFRQIKQNGWQDSVIFIEIGENQAKKIREVIKKTFPDVTLKTIKDLSHKDRVIRAEL